MRSHGCALEEYWLLVSRLVARPDPVGDATVGDAT
jgi:hypothetical protein